MRCGSISKNEDKSDKQIAEELPELSGCDANLCDLTLLGRDDIYKTVKIGELILWACCLIPSRYFNGNSLKRHMNTLFTEYIYQLLSSFMLMFEIKAA